MAIKSFKVIQGQWGPAVQSLYAAISVKQICLQQTPKARLSTKRNEVRTMFHTWGRIKVNCYTD